MNLELLRRFMQHVTFIRKGHNSGEPSVMMELKAAADLLNKRMNQSEANRSFGAVQA